MSELSVGTPVTVRLRGSRWDGSDGEVAGRYGDFLEVRVSPSKTILVYPDELEER
jgi:hypothetical protein